jgi:RNA polymerase primary sigma factor
MKKAMPRPSIASIAPRLYPLLQRCNGSAYRLPIGKQVIQSLLSSKCKGEDVFYVNDKIFRHPNIVNKIFNKHVNMDGIEDIWHQILNKSGQGVISRKMILTREEERLLFLQYNYARRAVALLQAQHRKSSLPGSRRIRLFKWYKAAMDIREKLIVCNLGLALARVRCLSLIPQISSEDLVQEANSAVVRCVEKFDISRGWKFSTYCTHAIIRSIYRQIKKDALRVSRFPVPNSEDEDFNWDTGSVIEDPSRRLVIEELRKMLNSTTAELSSIERQILDARFPMDERKARLTLGECGILIGVTKERIRQIQNEALDKLRESFEGTELERMLKSD